MAGQGPRLQHLGVNALFLQPRMGGIGTYVRRLLPALVEARPGLRVSVFVNRAGRELLAAEEWSPAVELVSHPLLGIRGTRALTETTLLGALASHRHCDVLHSVALTAPLRTRAANVVTIADVTWLRHPGAVPATTRLLWRTLVIPVARRADRLIALSESGRRDIARTLEVPDTRIDAIPLGPGDEPVAEPTPEVDLRSRLRLGDSPVILAVSALSTHKNVSALVEALPRIRERAAGATLVVPANPTQLGEELLRRAAELGLGDAVVFPGWLDERDLEGLYRLAACFTFPSLHEGFGLPVLEAMRRGVPVACSSAEPLPEVAGDAAAYFDPRNHGELADAVASVLFDPARAADLAERGRKRAEEFTWAATAEATLASYERALAAL
jgi:glycosyltransferase involved in cell wall biosynthesis